MRLLRDRDVLDIAVEMWYYGFQIGGISVQKGGTRVTDDQVRSYGRELIARAALPQNSERVRGVRKGQFRI